MNRSEAQIELRSPRPLGRWVCFRALRAALVVALCFAASSLANSACADELHLASGGVVRGKWLNVDEQPLTSYVFQAEGGVKLSYGLAQVTKVVRTSALQEAYEKKRLAAADTIDAQWQLAEWCRMQMLLPERRSHLRRIVELDPNHQLARGGLGYYFKDGEWITKSDVRQKEGYELYKGRWRTAQEIELIETKSKRELAQKEWYIRLQRIRNQLMGSGAPQAMQTLAEINSEEAAAPIAAMLARERLRRVKMVWVDVLANIPGDEALGILIEASLADPDEEMFHYCVDRVLDREKSPRTTEAYVASLKHPSNLRVNRAAAALGKIGDRSAISPLIDALITTHTHVIKGRPGTGPDSTTTSFAGSTASSSQPTTGAAMVQNEGDKILLVKVQNQHVLDALASFSGGASFGFDARAWRYWHSQEMQQRTTGTLDARRG
ncbi:hypothetical protein Psta_0011 [Pirellula staleyi DSM 6068]|uniref:PBS lyase HEAT domain protein repeat-containing protein n=1 Tax=Pirellula staleyi (strain ATCC 27377 / DSM 6068 / ICPB 4128) TaxID=530564 RepID=D2QZF0_PIRSD|nr:hypothetical protein [Pirellula staleyi]ADB14708.1 hypothetical protein Psta_0011 [Pirellula staleyi DSM 6068]